jgi:uncharacterized protein YcfJ
MSKFLKAFAAAVVLMAAQAGFAQGCVPAPQVMGQPAHCWGDRVVNVNGVNQVIQQPNVYGQYNQPGYYGQQVVPQYVPQQYIQQGVPQYVQQGNGILNNCSVLGGVIGGGIANYFTHHNKGATVAGVLGGGAVGNLICSNSQGQRVIVQQPQQQVQYVQAPAAVQQQPQVVYVTAQAPQAAPVPQSVRGVLCNIDGVVTEVASNDVCRQAAIQKAQSLVGSKVEVATTSTPSYEQGTSGVTPERQEAINRGCKSQTTEWRKLNWPGHPKHDTFVCMEPSDTHRY